MRRQPTVAGRIRGRMAEMGVHAKDFAKLFGVCSKTWSNWMSDPETQLNIGRLRVIAARLDTTPAALIGEGEA